MKRSLASRAEGESRSAKRLQLLGEDTEQVAEVQSKKQESRNEQKKKKFKHEPKAPDC